MNNSLRLNRKRLGLEILEDREMPSFGIDTSFGIGGIVQSPLGGNVHFDSIARVATLTNGKILAAGNLEGVNGSDVLGDVALVRLTSTGAMDSTFGGGDGLINLPLARHAVSSMAILPDGKILIGGSTGDPTNGSDFFVLRLNADGSQDTTFGTNGEVRVDFSGDELLAELAIQADGKIVLAGRTAAHTPSNFPSQAPGDLALARLSANGSLDGTFGTGGKLAVSPGDGDWSTTGLAVQPNGKIVVGGHQTPAFNVVTPGNVTELTVYRFNTNGTADTSFDSDGKAQTSYNTFTFAYSTSLALLANGQIVVGGGSSYGQGLLAWFNTNGSVIGQEQTDGFATEDIRYVLDIAASPKGGVTVLGYTYENTSYTVEYHAAPGLMSDRKSITIAPGTTFPTDLSVQPDGKFVIASLTSEMDDLAGWNANRLGLTRFSDPGVVQSPLTVMDGLLSHGPTGGPVTFQARVRPVLGPAELGPVTITFREGSQILGTVIQDSSSLNFGWPTLNIELPAGQHTVVAEFAGKTGWSASSFTFHVQMGEPAFTTQILISNPSPRYGDSVLVEARVQKELDGVTLPAPGLVLFYDGNLLVGGGALIDGKASLSIDNLSAGVHHIRTEYTAALSLETSQASSDLTVLPASATIELDPATTTAGVLLLFAKVRSSTNGKPLGIVNFYDGSTLLGTSSVDTDGTVAILTPALRQGTHTLKAVFSGNPNFLTATSAEQRITVGLVQTATTLTAPVTATAGQTIVLAAKITALSPGFPIGSVTFMEGNTVVGTARVDGRGDARLSTTLTAGIHVIRAVYSGCSTCDGSTSTAVSVTVAGSVVQVATTATLSLSVASPVHGQSQILRAKVTATAGQAVPTGVVNFYDGTKLLGSATVDSTGNALLTTIMTLGRHTYQAVFVGNSAFAGSSSLWLASTANLSATTVDLSAIIHPPVAGLAVKLSAKVHPQFGGSPIGSVTFKDGNTVVGTALVNGNGIATLEIGSLYIGHSITAIYSGSSTFKGSSSLPSRIAAV